MSCCSSGLCISCCTTSSTVRQSKTSVLQDCCAAAISCLKNHSPPMRDWFRFPGIRLSAKFEVDFELILLWDIIHRQRLISRMRRSVNYPRTVRVVVDNLSGQTQLPNLMPLKHQKCCPLLNLTLYLTKVQGHWILRKETLLFILCRWNDCADINFLS